MRVAAALLLIAPLLLLAGCPDPAGSPILTVSETRLDFGEVALDQTVTLALTLGVRGEAELSVAAPVLGGASPQSFGLQERTWPVALSPSSTAVVLVDFTPAEPGAVEASLVLEAAAPELVAGGGGATGAGVELVEPVTVRLVGIGLAPPLQDVDGDGHVSVDDGGDDCDDDDPSVHPGAEELCDGLDNDCDGLLGSEELDDDSDGVTECDGDCDDADAANFPGNPEVCDAADNDCDGLVPDVEVDDDGDGQAECQGDCDDADAQAYTGAVEQCDGLDNDCDGLLSEAETDDDGDGQTECDGDCDDTDADNFALNAEVCDGQDNDCDGSPGPLELDDDGDGVTECDGDCDDADATVFLGAVELCDGKDNDCVDGVPVEEFDNDGDGWAGCAAAVENPPWMLEVDCDDGDPAINPGQAEVDCDGIDNDCDGLLGGDELDDDGDGVNECDGDCDDVDAANFPGNVEVCDGADNDCDSLLGGDELDDDGDGVTECDGDCDDVDPDNFPGNSEICDGFDQDCSGVPDDNGPVDGDWYQPDADCDGFGAAAGGVLACDPPDVGWIIDATDCDDADPRVHDGALEACDGLDDDCDGVADNDCEDVIEIAAASAAAISAATSPQICAHLGEMTSAPTGWAIGDLPAYMAMLDGVDPGLTDSALVQSEVLDFSVRCGGDYLASPGNWTDSTTPWPTLASTGNYGGGRVRGYIRVGCGDPLTWTLGLLGNDALTLDIEGDVVLWVNWADGQWKKFRYVRFPGPGLYAFEAQWLTNLICDIDPFEVARAEGYVPGYGDYDTMCAYRPCIYDNGAPIPGFEIVGPDHLAQATDGGPTACGYCELDGDCPTGEFCNTAGICQP